MLRAALWRHTVLDVAQALAATDGTAVVLLEDWTPNDATALARHALAGPNVLHLPVRFDGGLTLIGPIQRPGVAGCLHCAERQRLATVGRATPWQDTRLRLAGVAPPALVDGIAALVDAILADPGGCEGMVWSVHGGRATWSVHRIRPVGGCDVCAPLPEDCPELARLDPVARPLPDAGTLRQPNPSTESATLRGELYDPRFGPVHHVYRNEHSVFGLSGALLSRGRPLPEGGYGRGLTFDGSERIALLEALERYATAAPTGRRTVRRASFAELGHDRAMDPVRLGLPDPAYDGHPRSATVPYTPDLVMDWVYGWSLTHRRAVAVPEHVAYWDPPCDVRVVYECSNGCGLGNSPEEATLYGLFEVAERDAFLMAWYAGTPLDLVRPPDGDRVLEYLTDRAALAEYHVTVLNATNDLGIPAVVPVATYTGDEPEAPQAFVAAGAHHDPGVAIRSALAEVVTNLCYVNRRAAAEPGWRDVNRLRRLLREPEDIVPLDDHVGVNTLPEARARIGAMVGTRQVELPAAVGVDDLTELLTRTVDRLAYLELEVVVVPVDEPGARERLGLSCVKVIVPGALPMTFGHVNHRTRGLPRLLEVPHRLGRAEGPLRYEDLPIRPHPFP